MKRLVAVLVLTAALAACGREPGPQQAKAPGEDEVLVTDDARAAAARSRTLAAVKRRGALRCGVNPGLAGFSLNDRGQWRGFDTDFCRALAAAVLGDPRKVQFVPLTNAQRFPALKAGRVDLLSRNTSWTFSRDAGEAVDFAGVSYYDGQGFLAPRSLNLQSASELSGARICVQSGSTSELNLDDYFRRLGVAYTAQTLPTEAEARAAYQDERCDVLTADISTLASARSLLNNPTAHVLLPDVISREPLGPVVRQGDPGWTDIVRWTLNALILAEQAGVTQKNAADLLQTSTDPEVRRLLGAEDHFGAMLGLSDGWAYDAIRAGGNYGEVFGRNVGAQSALRLERGLNAPWNGTPPGLLYSPPMR